MPSTNANAPSLHWGKAALTAVALGGLGELLWAKAIPCGFATVTHHPCPGCGSTRAVLALASGDWGGVVRNNPLGPVMALVLGGLVVQALTSALRWGDYRGVGGRRLTAVVMVVAAVEVVVWIARFAGLFGGPVPV